MNIKNEVLVRVYILLFGLVIPFAILLLVKTVMIGYMEGERWRAQGDRNSRKYKEIKADRGNIFAGEGSVLATDIPYYDIYFDAVASTKKDFMENLDSLAYCLSRFVDQSYTEGGFKTQLLQWRADSLRYVPLKKKVAYSLKQQVEQFPLFNLGRNRGGFIAERAADRRRPFGLLAQRTIGYVRENVKNNVGLEGYFNETLEGEPGGQVMVCIDPRNDIWKPVEDLMAIEPKSGDDIQTTIDVNLQDITEQALLDAMLYHRADWGTALLMEVKTGQIKAIANLGKYQNSYWETYNHAVGSSVEPGSTFKTASMLALLEDGFVDLEDKVFINKGMWEYYGTKMPDASSESFLLDTISIRKAFQISSNVGVSKAVVEHYGRRTEENKNEGAERFIKRLKQFNLHIPTGIEIEGSGEPYIKEAYSLEDDWSGLSLPWMSIGYELRLTPLQMLTFYNAIANDGTMMKPYLVKNVQRFGEIKKEFKPTIINKQIASKASIRAIQELLRGVVEEGTARKLKSDEYNFAGKTGTAQFNYQRLGENTTVGGYRVSFAGYFPAEDPLYSCVIVIENPQVGGNYGSEVAGPVFRRIADETYGAELRLHELVPMVPSGTLTGRRLPGFDIGYQKDMKTLMDQFGLPYYGTPQSEIAVIRTKGDSLTFEQRTLPDDVVPTVTGLGLKDALYVLENRGLKVKIEGFGKVVNQSLLAGTPIRGQEITLYLK